jgi:peptidoglycan/LPS O-acetylase OafA/YrhL
MITAFLFYGKIVQSRGIVNWSSLYIGRIFRLTPMYWIVVALMVLVAFWHMNFTLTVSLFDLCKSVAGWLMFTLFGEPLINGYDQTSYIPSGAIWTLRYEWAFYFLLPIIALIIRQCGNLQRSRIAAILVATVAVKFVRDYTVWGFWLNLGSPFLLGMLCYELTLIPALTKLARSNAASALVLGSVVGLLITPDLSHWSLFNLLLFTAFLPISAGNSVFGILTLSGSKVLGDASYSIYILHGTALHVLFQNMPEAASGELGWLWLLLPVVTAAVAATSIFLYSAIELPFVQFGKRFIASGTKQALTISYSAGVQRRALPIGPASPELATTTRDDDSHEKSRVGTNLNDKFTSINSSLK